MGVFTEKFSIEQEGQILSHYVSAPFKDVFFVYDALPPEQFATLAASYSRTHEPFQKRLLKSIESGDLPFQGNWGERGELLLPNISNAISPEKTKRFIEKWAQEYGHNSIKEMANVRFVCENIPDLTGKIITGHPLAHPQVKSSRYLDWNNILELSEKNLDITNSKNKDLILSTLKKLGDAYSLITNQLEQFVKEHPLNKQFYSHRSLYDVVIGKKLSVEALEIEYDKDSKKSVLDYSRYLLTPAMSTSLACSINVRALEEVITNLLSSPLKQDNYVGEQILNESRKAVPILMGEKSYAKKSTYQVKSKENMLELLPQIFEFEKKRTFERGERTSFLKHVNETSDLFAASAIAWQYGNGSFMQYYDSLLRAPQNIKKIFSATLRYRDWHDSLSTAFLIEAPAFETLMDYGGDRDNHRHRRGAFLRQILTTEHGFETPQIIKDAGLIDEKYVAAMKLAENAFNLVRQDEPHIAQLLVPFAYRCRRLLSWSPGQKAYYVELRSKSSGHDSYRDIALNLSEHIDSEMPLLSEYIRVDKREYPQHLIKGARSWYDSTKRE
ncbi:MAG: FAD-dependent thymidylate synthase [Candidatus Woesearchaeota archaeon]|jgi:thymidylate synthase ThyX